MSETFSRYDTADYLKTAEDISAYLEASAEANDPVQMKRALFRSQPTFLGAACRLR